MICLHTVLWNLLFQFNTNIFHTDLFDTSMGLLELLPMLYFDLWPGQKCHSKVMHWKKVTHSNGSYERKSRGRKLADEIGWGKKFPWYTHRLMHRKRVTSELHDSYFYLMTIKHAISKIEWAIEWALNYYIISQDRNQVSWVPVPVPVGDGVIDEKW